MFKSALFGATVMLAACSAGEAQVDATQRTETLQATAAADRAEAVFAGGCFWCVEADFEKLPGVEEVVSGYTGGRTRNPTYEEVVRENTGHYEAAKVIYDPSVVSYEELLDHYWTTVDPTDAEGQFCDKGNSYRTAIFATPEQMEAARESLEEVKATKPFEAPIVTPVLEAQRFYDAESYHQDYYRKKRVRYNFYRTGCGRDARLEQLWGDRAGKGLG